MKKIHYILFSLAFISKAFLDVLFVSKGNNTFNSIKYIFMLTDIILLLLEEVYNRKHRINHKTYSVFSNEYKNITFVVSIFIIMSLISIFCSGEYTAETIKELFYLFIPAIYAFLLLNTLSEKEITKYFNTLLVCYTIAYFMEIDTKISEGNFEVISYANSYSPFESSYIAGAAISLFFYFLYNNDRIRTIISFILVFMTFKRLAIVFACVMLILRIIKNMDKNVSNFTIKCLKLSFIILPLLIYYFLRPYYIFKINNALNIDLDKFLMGRATIFNYVLNAGYKSYGFGSTTALVKQLFSSSIVNLHLDLVKIYMETSIVGLIVFVNCFWNIAGKNIYSVLIMLFNFLNLLTSHSLDGSFSWLMTYLIIGTITLKNNNEKELENVRV